MIKNPLIQSQYIKEKFSKYVRSTFVLRNEKYNNDFIEELNNSVLTKGPYLKLELPFTKSFTINQLIESKELPKSFARVSDIVLDRPLYLHQYQSLKRIQKGANIVVTTGTGSGKTEAFFYPILDNLLRKIEKNKSLTGIQAILLYPMNALVNDQLERLRKHLSTVPEITFGFFTGDTPEKYQRKLTSGRWVDCNREQFIKANFDEEDTPPPQNELLVRTEIRETPPNILITNFSMLEYLLVRPKDSAILNAETLKDWSFMVLDEAHTYRGTLATEVSHLLKRLQAYAHRSPQFILTSATLGNTEEDKKKIIEFASKLTSGDYTESDIIYANRISPTKYEIKHVVDNKDYPILLKLHNENKSLDSILEKYNVSNLFDLLSHDRNVHELYYILRRTNTFNNAFNQMRAINSDITREEFVDLINLVTLAKKDGKTIYDVKYHFFIRTLEGAFVSLKPKPKLRISNRQTIGDMWAFEIGACKYCNTMYIIGKEYNKKLFRSELDLDENYENFDDLKVDFYLLKEDVENSVDIESEEFEPHTVCSKCGHIYQNNHHGHTKCNCGDEYQVELLKVVTKDNSSKTNLTSCPVCTKTSNKTGVINSFKLGKDQSTALISQILLKSMDLFNEEGEKENKTIDLFKPVEIEEKKVKYKQFLAFSDSRQQASFFALFFQENQNKFLRKALVLQNLKTSMDADSIITSMERMIKDNNLFTDNAKKQITPKQNAYVSVLLELFKSDGINSLEGLGLLSFEPNVDRLIENITDEQLKHYMPKIKHEQLRDLISIFVDAFRTAPAINYDKSGLDSDDRAEYLEYRKFDNYVMLKVPPKTGDRSLRSILPVKENGSNNWVKYLEKTYNLSKSEIESYSNMLWRILSNPQMGVIKLNNDSEGQINFADFKIIKKEDRDWYVCSKCGNLTTHNINDSCVKGDCAGTLIPCNPDKLLKDNYYRNEYLEKKIEPIVVQEHTGQLTREKAKEYQKGFKNKEINVLSSSTTFEMGVNIGSLDTVFMRNIPPTNSNYAQRAGRAGRSDESVAFVVTYASHNSHDQIYFNEPVPMIDGKINPPYFKLENNKITIRHIMAFLISQFYRQNYYEDTLGVFISGVYEDFFKYINENKVELEKMLKEAVNENSFDSFKNYKWLDEMNKKNSLLNECIINVGDEIKNLEIAEEEATKNKDHNLAKNYRDQINRINNLEIVNGLAKYNVIPGYGFPLDVVPLKIYDKVRRRFNTALDLNRDLSLALSEYAPDSEVVVDKNKYTSRYIILPREGSLPRYFYYKCTNEACGKIHVDSVGQHYYKCANCGSDTEDRDFIIPNLGFISDAKNKEDTILKPRKTYASEVNYLGSLEPFLTDVVFNDMLLIQQQNDDKLLIVNENPFFQCQTCGYSKLEKKWADVDEVTLPHQTYRGHECSDKVLKKITLGHIIVTDVIKMRINLPMTYEVALSTIYAMLNGITAYLQIDANDINGIIVNDLDGKYAFIFYDTTYGGAGNVKHLTDTKELRKMLELALDSVNADCCDEEVSCTSCLRNYRNSRNHKYLKRKYARDTLKTILK